MESNNKKNLIVGNARFEDGEIIKPNTNDNNSLIDKKKKNLDYLYIFTNHSLWCWSKIINRFSYRREEKYIHC